MYSFYYHYQYIHIFHYYLNLIISWHFYNLLNVGVSKFIKNHILCFENATEVPIHFIGSIAHFSESIIKECFKNHNLELGKIIQKPVDGLIEYYRNHKLN